MADNEGIPDRVREEAARISLTERVASVYLLRSGRYVATTTEPHMIAGRRLEVYKDGKKTRT
jgi:hypothetical protein